GSSYAGSNTLVF
nr:immunoglobulin light chain junction region [Macaca mulatta]MPN67750.1 immunoglobulin light chain junction region [Macaca mulatta]